MSGQTVQSLQNGNVAQNTDALFPRGMTESKGETNKGHACLQK